MLLFSATSDVRNSPLLPHLGQGLFPGLLLDPFAQAGDVAKGLILLPFFAGFGSVAFAFFSPADAFFLDSRAAVGAKAQQPQFFVVVGDGVFAVT